MSEMCIWLATMLSDFTYNIELQGLRNLQVCVSSVEIETLKWGYKHPKDQFGKFGIFLHSFLFCFLPGKCWKPSRPILVCQHYPGSL